MANYPTNYNNFVTKIDKNASGWYITGENFNVPSSPYTIYSDHVPKDAATTYIYASGGGAEWTEDITGTPAAGEFYVDYDTGLFTFNSADNGTALEAKYYTLGDDIMSEHINTLQLAASGVQYELGLGIRGGYQTLAQRLDTFRTISGTTLASAVTCVSPGAATFTDVQGHIDSAGAANVTNANPHGVAWNDIFDTDGDINRADKSITTNNLFADTVGASGSYMGINIYGPDADSYLYFYEDSAATGAWLKWDDGNDRFEFSDELLLHGGVTASGDMMPEASGTYDIGSVGFAWDDGYFDSLEAATSIYSPMYLGDGSNLDGITFTQLDDTPSAYGAYTASGVRVNSGGTGLEFCDLCGSQTLEQVTDLGAVTTNDISITSTVTASPVLEIENTNADTTAGYLKFIKNSASPAVDDVIGNIDFIADDSIGSQETYASIVSISHDVNNDHETGHITFNVSQDGTLRAYLKMYGTGSSTDSGAVKFNDDARDIDLIVKTASDASAFIVDSGDNEIQPGINIIPDASGTLNIGSVAYAFDEAHIDKVYLEDDPIIPFQAATKQYVDTQIPGGGSELIKAWVSVDYDPTIVIGDSYGVDSITDSVGELKVYWTTAFSSVNYAVFASPTHTEAKFAHATNLYTTYVDIDFRDDAGTKGNPNRGASVMAIGA